MLTDNGKKLIASLLTAGGITIARVPVKSTGNQTVYAGPTINGSGWPQNGSTISFSTTGMSIGVVIGSGNTPVQSSDYKLDAPLASDYSGSVSKINGDTESSLSLKLAVVIQNSGSSALTVREIGLIQSARTATTQGGSLTTNTNVLIERTVLSTPVTIAAGESETIDYTITVEI